MKHNVGRYDRIARLVLGLLLVAVGVIGFAGLVDLALLGLPALAVELVAVLVGLYLVATGRAESCPVYGVLGIDTVAGDVTATEATDETTGTERPKAN